MEKRDARFKNTKNKGWRLRAGLMVVFSLCLVCAGLYFVTLQIEKTLWYPRTAFFSAEMSWIGWNIRFLGMDFQIVFRGGE
jgi:nitric oxide reductase large subunit